jgi:hypothetical protein
MKKSFALITSLIIILSGCSHQTLSPTFTDFQQVEQPEVFTAQDYEAEKSVGSNKNILGFAVETVFAQNFADDLDIPAANKINPLSIAKDVQQKGGMLYNMLTKSKLAQKLGYLIADLPIRLKFNLKSKPDNIPRITEQQIAELKGVLKPGDLILNGNNGSFIHCILYLGNDVIIHSLATKGVGKNFIGTIKETLSEYLARVERDKFVVLRYKNSNPDELAKVFSYAEQQVGKNYDSLFLMNSDTRLYCTELIYQAEMQFSTPPRMVPHKAALGWQVITNEDFLDSPDFETVWSLNHARPAVAQLHRY